ncbi:MAG: flagellar protein FlgN [Nitrospira sp.]|nr:flagellar protein FlgN [Nitrospira sp.]
MTPLSPMPDLIDLCRHLSREEAVCRSLLETVQEERLAIRRLDIAEFHPINCRRLALLESLQQLAQESDQLVRQLAVRFGFPQTTSVQSLMDHLTVAESADLRAMHRSFMGTAKVVRDEIAQNAVLIEGIRGLIDQALSAGSEGLSERDGYGSDGRRAQTTSGNILLYQQG